jgi:subtilisin-like proprotein convertase family protein
MLSIASHYLNRAASGRGQGWNTPDLWDAVNHRTKAAEYRTLETMLNDLAARKILVFPFAGFFGKSSNFPTNPADQEFYIRYTLARLGSYWNVMLAVAGPEPLLSGDESEYQFAMGFSDISRLGNLIHGLDVFGHLLSNHNVTGANAFKNEPWESYTTLQGPKTVNRRDLGAGLLAFHSAQPLLAEELLWPGDTLGHPVYSDTDIRKNGFVMMMSAAAINFGDMNGTSSSGFSGSMDPADKIQSRHDIIKRVWDFFETQPFYRMSPRQDLVNNGWCLADSGREYLVYLDSRGSVSVTVTNGPYQVEWFNAKNTEDKRTATTTANGQNLASPIDGDDWVLHLYKMTGTNTAPTITNLADQTTSEDTPAGPIAFSVGDRETPPGDLSLTGSSSNPTLVPNGNIVFGGSGANRTLTVRPAANQNGTATLTVTVSDGSLTASETFVLTVNAVNDPPSISSIPNQTINPNGTTGPLGFTVSDAESPATSLNLNGNSSDPSLVPVSNITFGGSGSSRTVTVTPANGQTGSATISVNVSDGQSSASNSFVVTVTSLVPGTKSFTNSMAITIPDVGAASPYPSTIDVADTSGTVGNVTLTLGNLGHSWTRDIDVVLVGPTGKSVMVMSDAGSGGANNVTLTFSDAAASSLPQTSLSSGTFKPANYTDASSGGDNFPSPTPSGPYGATLSTFNGESANGTWALYVVDDGPGDQGAISEGWILTITTTGSSGGTAPTISDIPDQSTSANTPTAAIPFTINDSDTPVSSLSLTGSSSNPTLVPNANIVFGGSGSNRTVTVTPANGQTGTTTISVTVSDGSLTVTDTFLMTVSGQTQTTQTLSFTNGAAITIPNVGGASPYPSTINVTGANGTVSQATLTLRNLSHTWTRDIDVMLVGPTGESVMVMSDAGSGGANNVTLTFSDAAASSLPQTPLTSGTFKPANYTDASSGGDSFPSPAPSGPYGAALSVFNGQSANGTWSLYVLDDGSGDEGSIAGGWSLTITATTGASSATIASSAPLQNPARITSITSDTYGAIQLSVSGVPGRRYALEASSDYVAWTTLTIQGNQTGTLLFSDAPTTNRFRFYRAVSVP